MLKILYYSWHFCNCYDFFKEITSKNHINFILFFLIMKNENYFGKYTATCEKYQIFERLILIQKTSEVCPNGK